MAATKGTDRFDVLGAADALRLICWLAAALARPEPPSEYRSFCSVEYLEPLVQAAGTDPAGRAWFS
jgi:hypothetical protein